MPRGDGIFVMPSISEQIGPDLQNLAGAISQFRNPNIDIQRSLRQAIAQNPALLQQLVDLGPDKVGKIFGKEAGFLGVGDLSNEEQMKRAVSDLLKTDPTFKEEIIAAKTGTKTKTEREAQKLDIEGKQISNRTGAVQANVAEATEDDAIKQFHLNTTVLNQQVSDMQQAVNKIPNIGAIDINKVARDAFRGRGDPMVMMRLKQAGIDVSPLVNSLQQNAEIAARFSLEHIRQQSKEVQLMGLAPLEKLADDNRNMIEQYNSVIKNLSEGYRMARIMTKPKKDGKVDTSNPMYAQSMETIRQYEDAMRGRDRAIQDYQRYDDKRKGLVGIIYGMDGGTPKAGPEKGKVTSTEAPPPPSEIAPAAYAPAIKALEQMSPEQRKVAVEEVKKADPVQYNNLAPYIGAIDKVISAPKKGIAESIFSGTQAVTGKSQGLTSKDYSKAANEIGKVLKIAGPRVLKILRDYGNNRLEKSRDANRVVEYLQMNPDSLPSISAPDIKTPATNILDLIQSVKYRPQEPPLNP